jgi:hypothetical protein
VLETNQLSSSKNNDPIYESITHLVACRLELPSSISGDGFGDFDDDCILLPDTCDVGASNLFI